jgi:hypothetical protein
MYKSHFEKSNIELWKARLSAFTRICKLHVQISSIHMCIVPGPASQDAVSDGYTLCRVYSVMSVSTRFTNNISSTTITDRGEVTAVSVVRALQLQ